MRSNSEFGIRNSEWPPSARKTIWKGRALNPISEIRNPKLGVWVGCHDRAE
jgi:hypothetical protein